MFKVSHNLRPSSPGGPGVGGARLDVKLLGVSVGRDCQVGLGLLGAWRAYAANHHRHTVRPSLVAEISQSTRACAYPLSPQPRGPCGRIHFSNTGWSLARRIAIKAVDVNGLREEIQEESRKLHHQPGFATSTSTPEPTSSTPTQPT
jgi:hypothetical protein